jgi:hypothetical protein
MCSKFKSKSALNTNNSTIQGLHIGPYDVHLDLHSIGFQVTSQSSGGLTSHTNLPQHPQYSDISAHNLQAKLEQLKLSKT